MAHIPYGYIILEGKAQIDPGCANWLVQFFKNYLGGLSIEAAGADIPRPPWKTWTFLTNDDVTVQTRLKCEAFLRHCEALLSVDCNVITADERAVRTSYD